MTSSFIDTVNQAISPLIQRFGLHVGAEAEDASAAEVLYLNRTTGLRVRVDWGEFRAMLTIYKLVDGKVPPGQPPSEAHLPRLAFDVDDLLLLRAGSGSPVGKMLHERDHAQVSRLLGEYASALQKHAADVLSGDFSVFPVLEQRVASRYAQLSGSSPPSTPKRRLP